MMLIGTLEARGEQGLLAVSAEQLTRLRSNPFFSYVERRLIETTRSLARTEIEDSERRALHCRDKLVPAMERARAASDELEGVIPVNLWTLPTYAEMLFQR